MRGGAAGVHAAARKPLRLPRTKLDAVVSYLPVATNGADAALHARVKLFQTAAFRRRPPFQHSKAGCTAARPQRAPDQ